MKPAKTPPLGIDLYSPADIADRVEAAGVTKAHLPLLKLFTLALMAGAFIALGAMFYTIVAADHGLTFGVGRVLGGLVFSLGLVLVVIAGAELFTGNNLIVMAWADGKVSTGEVLRNWAVVPLTWGAAGQPGAGDPGQPCRRRGAGGRHFLDHLAHGVVTRTARLLHLRLPRLPC